jgi:Secretion system C-terminal sorting domain
MRSLLLLILSFLLLTAYSFAQTGPEINKPVYFDVSPPLRDLVKTVPDKADNSWKVIMNHFNMKKRHGERFPSDWKDPLVLNDVKLRATSQDTIMANFDGNSNSQGYDPPDVTGQVGPEYYFGEVNCHFSIYNKAGTKVLGPVGNSVVWNGMPNNMNGGDGIVMYDADADRWFFSQLSYPAGGNYVMIAVSQTSDPTGSWYRWEYSFNGLPDYPKFGIWPDGYYMSVNRFPNGYQGTGMAAFDRVAMIAGNSSAQMVYFTLPASNNAYSFLPSSCDGELPPMGTPNYFVYMNESPPYLGVYEFHVDWTTTSNSTFGNYLQLPVTAFNSNLSGIPQKGTNVPAEVLSDRLMYRLQFRKFSDHWSMVSNHTVNAGSNVAGVRWYEMQKTTGNPWTVYQQSTYAPADSKCRWMASVAMDSANNIALGFSISSSSMFPSIKYTGRMKNDALNTMSLPERGIVYGTGSNTSLDGGSTCRWGDYSTMTVDPADGTTFWYTQQYMAGNGINWVTRIASFNFFNLMSVAATANPFSICQGDSTHLDCFAAGGSGTYTYSWTSNPAGFVSTLKNPSAAPPVSTTFIVSVSDGTKTLTDSVYITVHNKATVFAGNDTIFCSYVSEFTVHGSATNFDETMWSTLGDGHFTNPINNLVTQYIPWTQDKLNGVNLVLVAHSPLPCSGVTFDTVHISFDECTGMNTTSKDLTVCIQPNPSRGSMDLLMSNLGNQTVNIDVTDLLGREIYRKTYADPGNRVKDHLNLSIPAGTYLLHVKTTTISTTEKLIIQ